MIKKVMISLFIVGITQSVFAVPSVKMLGNNKLNSANVKPVTNVPTKNTGIKANNSRIGKITKLPTVKAVSTTASSDDARFPAISNVKSFNVVKNIKPSAPVNTSVQPSNTGVSEDTFNETVNRIEDLENKTANAVTDVVESEPGNYVTDIAVDGNKLNVTKTKLLYAPVRNGTNETITGDAEIWIVK